MENKITINICGEEYTFAAEEPPSYMQKVAAMVDAKMSEILQATHVSRTDAAVLSAVVMYDACNVRRSAGDTAKLVNQLLAHVEKLTAEDFADDLKIIMGHTPLQVAAGALLGLGIGLLA